MYSAIPRATFESWEFTGVTLTWHALIDFCYVTSSKNGVYGTPEVRKANQRIRRHVKGMKSERLLTLQLWPATKQTYESVVKLKVKKPICAFILLFFLNLA